MIGTGIVKSIKQTFAEIMADTGNACESCVLNGECNRSTLKEDETIFVRNDVDAEVGDVVQFEYDEKEVIKGIFVVYMIPFASMLIGFIIGVILEKGLGVHIFKLQNATTVSFSVVFLLASVPVVRKIDRGLKSHSRVIDILAKGNIKKPSE
jgi:positive regulator of sigma E activity